MMTACWYEKIFVVQKPVQRGYRKKGYDVTLYVDYKGQNKIHGKETYKQNSKELEDAIKKAYIYAYKKLILGE
jgi:hypothetical protein|tara:strand:- start:258 stop:476 length:219 start_codon:yes stop_codon:yes gene_type:complete